MKHNNLTKASAILFTTPENILRSDFFILLWETILFWFGDLIYIYTTIIFLAHSKALLFFLQHREDWFYQEGLS